MKTISTRAASTGHELRSGRGRRRAVGACLLLLSGFAGCADRAKPPAPTGGSLVISAFAEPDVLLPPLSLSGPALQVVDNVFDRLLRAEIDSSGQTRYAPMLATEWTWSNDSMAIDFVLPPDARWHDGAPVTANDVRFSFLAYTDSALASPAASSLSAIDSIEVRDSHTARVWFRQRRVDRQVDAVSQMHVLPQHLLDSLPRTEWRTSAFARQPVGSGRFRFGRWQAGTQLDLVADSTNSRGRPGLDRVIWTVSPDPAAATARLFAGEADFLESIRPDAAGEFGAHPNVRLLRSPSLVYGFLQFNLTAPNTASRPHPVFADRALRQALSMLVDRQTAVRAVFDSLAMVAVGPMTRVHLEGDSTVPILPFDPVRGGALLDSLGWRRDASTGRRMRNGTVLRFSVLVPASSAQRVRLATVLQQQFGDAGVTMDIESVEFNTLMSRVAEGRFDAAVMAIGADRHAGGIRGVWSAAAAMPGGGPNFGRYISPRFDALLDSADVALDEQAAQAFYRRAWSVILDDAPAIWLYEPWNLAGISRAIRPVGVGPSGWWTRLADWTRSSDGGDTTRETTSR